MKRFLILSGLWMGIYVAAPVALMAHDHHSERRYYDRDGEDRQYRAYLVDQHRVYVPFVRVRSRQRQEYFRLRSGRLYYERLAHRSPAAYPWAWQSGW
jgi:hypothetical protein